MRNRQSKSLGKPAEVQTGSVEGDDDYRFYRLTPVLVRITRHCDSVWGCITNLPGWCSDSPSEEEFRESKERIFTVFGKSSYADKLKELRDCLDNDGLREFTGRSSRHFQKAIDRLLNANTPKECARAAELVFSWILGFDEWVVECRNEYFGEWGHRFLNYATEDATPDNVARFARQFGPLEHQDSEDATIDCDEELLGMSKPRDHALVTILPERFSVKVAENECILGNTKLFRLFLVLARRANQFVSCQRIVEQMGDDSLSIGSLKQHKYLLASKLCEAHCESLADAIIADKDHYGLFAERHNLTLQPMGRTSQRIDQDLTVH